MLAMHKAWEDQDTFYCHLVCRREATADRSYVFMYWRLFPLLERPRPVENSDDQHRPSQLSSNKLKSNWVGADMNTFRLYKPSTENLHQHDTTTSAQSRKDSSPPGDWWATCKTPAKVTLSSKLCLLLGLNRRFGLNPNESVAARRISTEGLMKPRNPQQ